MTQPQTLETIAAGELGAKIRALRTQGYRMIQVTATALADHFEVTYSFGINCTLVSIRVEVPKSKPRVPSISSLFPAGFLYENELHDLFGLEFDGLTVDFKGNFYKTSVKFPLTSVEGPCTQAARGNPAVPVTPKTSAPEPAK